MPPERISLSPCCLCNRRRIRSHRLPPCVAYLWFLPVPNRVRRAETPHCGSVVLSRLQLELLLEDSCRILSSPLFYLFRPGLTVPSSGGEMNCKYVMQTRACYLWTACFLWCLWCSRCIIGVMEILCVQRKTSQSVNEWKWMAAKESYVAECVGLLWTDKRWICRAKQSVQLTFHVSFFTKLQYVLNSMRIF